MYDWAVAQAQTKHAVWTLAIVSFAESSFFPIPPDAMLVPMCLAERRKAFLFAAVCTIASVLGGMAGYAIGYFLIESLGTWIINLYGYDDALHQFQQTVQEYGVWFVLIKGLTPIPYKLVTIGAGAGGMAILPFFIASLVTRGVRFFAEAALLWYFGPPVKAFIERHLTLVSWAFLIALVGGIVAVRYLM